MNVSIKRVYEDAADKDGYRVLVDRVWPRGVSKEAADLDEWCQELAPSTELRKWFDHRADRFEEFAERYREELIDHPDIERFEEQFDRRRKLTLLYGAKDPEINHAVVLAEVLRG